MKKNYEFEVRNYGRMVGDYATLDRAYAKWGFANVYVIRSW